MKSRRAAFLALWLGVAVQVVWSARDYLRAARTWDDVRYPAICIPAAIALGLTRGRVRWVAAIPRLLLGVSFLANVGDRLGFLGPRGTPGVSWGDFQHFLAYTARVNAFAPRALIPALGVIATVAEGVLGLAMLLGIQLRLAAAASALLLFLFATAMTLSGLSQFEYAVYLMAIGAWVLATIDASLLSVDALLLARKARSARSQPTIAAIDERG